MSLTNKLKLLPDKPGVYLMKDQEGTIIYVGKAISLKNRVRSYFQQTAKHLPKTKALVSNIADLEYILTDSEVEALILECNLIKEHRPKYNVNLKDDKQYPYLKMTLDEEYPRIIITRQVRKDGGKYFGPYPSAGAVKDTLALLKKIFPLRTCKKKDISNQKRPCLNFHIKRCLAPCTQQVDKEIYQSMVKDVTLFLEGRHELLLNKLQAEMERAAEELQFELAGQLRDQIHSVQKVAERQKIVSNNLVDQDVLAMARGFDEVCVAVFFVRGGKILGRETHFLTGTDELGRSEVMTEFVKQFYAQVEFIPKEILLQESLVEADVISTWLAEKKGQKVFLQVPKRGEKQKLVEMVAKNALQELEQHNQEQEKIKAMTEGALVELKDSLGLLNLPKRIECYDISNTQGTESVGSMVVFVDGKPANSEYRRFRIKTVEGPNDFASMNEVINRRFKRARGADDKFVDLPDLVIIDGGKGQLSAAREAMRDQGFAKIATFGLAKEFELLFREDQADPIALPRNSKALYLLQRIRDEAHRFAITYHRNLRSKRNLKSVLEDIPGIGAKRKQNLYKHFGSLTKIKEASVEDLLAVPGMNKVAAVEVWEFFNAKREEIE